MLVRTPTVAPVYDRRRSPNYWTVGAHRAPLQLLLLLTLLVPTAHAQQPFTIKIDTQLVVETVVVKDKDGRTIEGLTEKDFIVSEDSVPQNISVFEFQKLDDTAAPAPAAAPVSAVRSTNQRQISPPPPGDA